MSIQENAFENIVCKITLLPWIAAAYHMWPCETRSEKTSVKKIEQIF